MCQRVCWAGIGKMAESQAVRLGAAVLWGQGKRACTGTSVSELAKGDRPDRGWEYMS